MDSAVATTRYVSSWQIPNQLTPLSRTLVSENLPRGTLIAATRELRDRIAQTQPLIHQHQPIDRRISSAASAKFVRY